MDQPATTGRLRFVKFISRAMTRAEPDTLFLFGDNMARVGFGGQAAELRGALNAVGVPTKHEPSLNKVAYFTNSTIDDKRVIQAIDDAFSRAASALMTGRDVVIPADGLGTGLAQLPHRAPAVFAHIEQHIATLRRIADS